MCDLIKREEFHKADVGCSDSPEKYLSELWAKVESISISQYVHPDTEKYIYRVLNTFLHGWYYYPLFDVASTLSFIALEVSLRRIYAYQLTYKNSSLRKMLDRAISDGIIRIEETVLVKEVFEQQKFYANLEPFLTKPISIKEIASGREKVLKEKLPELRGYQVHPDFPSLFPQSMVFEGIKHVIELINIASENSFKHLRALSQNINFNWNDIKYLQIEESPDSAFRKVSEFQDSTSIPLQLVESLIHEVSDFLALERRSILNELSIHNDLRILPSKPFNTLSNFLKNNRECPLLHQQETVNAVKDIEQHCINQFSSFSSCFALCSKSSKLSFEFIRKESRWKVRGTSPKYNNCISVKSTELPYYLLIRLGLWGVLGHRTTTDICILKKALAH